jgi:hypothetical protein
MFLRAHKTDKEISTPNNFIYLTEMLLCKK